MLIPGLGYSQNFYFNTGQSSMATTPVSPVTASQNSINSKNQLESQASRPINYSPSLNQQSSSSNTSASQNRNAQDRNNPDSGSTVASQSTNQTDNQKVKQQELQVQQVLNQLKARDTEVRAHEMAHLAVAGQYAKGMSFSYQTGPDGKQYAIGGEVGIDTSPVSGDPQATIEKARVIQRAALAPAEPSNQDRRVAQAATQMMQQAQVELAMQKEVANEEGLRESENSSSASQVISSGNTEGLNQIKAQGYAAEVESSNGVITARNQFDLRVSLSGLAS